MPSDRQDANGAAASRASGAVAYVPRALLDSLSRAPDRPSPWVERVSGTLLMGDVSGFTAMSELLAKAGKEGAEWLTEIINSFFGTMLGHAKGYGGDTITFGGDAVLLLFQGEDHARRACAAALTMLDATASLPAFKVGSRRIHLGMSMGAHSGDFFLGSAGLTHTRLQCILFGPGAAKTCLAEAAASSGELFVTHDTVGMLPPEAGFEEHDGFSRVLRVPMEKSGEHATLEPSKDMLRRLTPYLPPQVATGLREHAPARDLESDHRKVCVVFINLMDVDPLLEAEGAEAVLADLDAYTAKVVDLCDRYGGYVVSNDVYTLGVKLILAFGAPFAHEHDTAHALSMVAALKCEVERMGLRLQHRIGVNAGFVFAGDVGPGCRRQYTVMGDAVNLTARLMSAAKADEVYVSSATVNEAGGGFVVEELAPISVKGKSAPIPVCTLLGECEEQGRDDSTRLIGREDEARLLERAAERAASGCGAVALVRGEPGIGKSHLTQSLTRSLQERSWLVLTGGGQAHTADEPFSLWAAPLKGLMGIRPGAAEGRKADAVLATVTELTPDLLPWASLLAPLLGVSIPESEAVRALKEADRRSRLFGMIADLVRAQALRDPVALLLEDLHWADTSSLALLEHMARAADGARVLVLATSRLRPELPLGLPADALRIDLEELPESMAFDVVSEVLGRTDLPEEMARILLHKARGNPLFLQEVARAVAASGSLDRMLASSGSDLAAQIASLDIPDKIQGLVMSRIDALPERTRDLLRTASVIGTTFERSTLEGVVPDAGDPTALDAGLESLVAQAFADPEASASRPTYRFHHALIQEIAYDSLRFSRRRDLHGKIARHLERRHSRNPEPVYESLVHHFSAARDDEKTRVYAVKAGDKARRLFAHDEAAAFYRRGMTTLRARSAAAAGLRSFFDERVGDTLEAAGRPAKAAGAYRDALRRWTAAEHSVTDTEAILRRALDLGFDVGSGPKARRASLSRKIGFAYSRTYCDYDLSLEWLDRAMEALPPGQRALRGQIAVAKSSSHFRKGEFEESMRWARRGLELAARCDDKATRAYGLGLIASSCFELGRLRQSIRYDSDSLPLYTELNDLWGQGSARLNLGTSYAALAMLDEALEHFESALEIWQRIGNEKETGLARVNIAEALVIRGEYDAAVAHLFEALSACRRVGSAFWLSGFAELNLARAYQGKGLLADAYAAAERSVSLMKRAQTPGMLAEALVQRAELECEMDRVDSGRETCESAVEMLRSLGMKRVESRGLRVRGLLHGACGESGRAESALLESVGLAEQANAPFERGLALLSLAELYAMSDDPALGGKPYRRLARNATAAFSKVGAHAWVDRAERVGIAGA